MYDDTDMLYAYDLDGAKGDVVVVIEKVFAGELVGQKGRKSKKPFVKFQGKEKKLALNKTNGKAIATMYGTDTDAWAGKPIALYTTTVDFEGEAREAIRVRPRAPEMPRGERGRGNGQRSAAQRGAELQGQIRDQMGSAAPTAAAGTDDQPQDADEAPETGSQADE
jgi:hypothetical protein